MPLSCLPNTTHENYSTWAHLVFQKRFLFFSVILQCFKTRHQSFVSHQLCPFLCLGLWHSSAVASSLCFDSPVQCCLNSMPQGNTVRSWKQREYRMCKWNVLPATVYKDAWDFPHSSIGVCPWGWRGYSMDCHFYCVTLVRWFYLSSPSASLKKK